MNKELSEVLRAARGCTDLVLVSKQELDTDLVSSAITEWVLPISLPVNHPSRLSSESKPEATNPKDDENHSLTAWTRQHR